MQVSLQFIDRLIAKKCNLVFLRLGIRDPPFFLVHAKFQTMFETVANRSDSRVGVGCNASKNPRPLILCSKNFFLKN